MRFLIRDIEATSQEALVQSPGCILDPGWVRDSNRLAVEAGKIRRTGHVSLEDLLR
jgi:hypothetical protein